MVLKPVFGQQQGLGAQAHGTLVPRVTIRGRILADLCGVGYNRYANRCEHAG
jgi:hypothetical protein